jgi:hypothetical protein
MVRNHVVIIAEFVMADRAYSTLLPDLPVQQFAHLRRRSQFPVSPRVVRIFNPLNSKSYRLGPGKELSTTAGERFVNWAQFIGAECHGIPLICVWNRKAWECLQIDTALAALNGSSPRQTKSNGSRLSAAARAKIAAAHRTRWAKLRANQGQDKMSAHGGKIVPVPKKKPVMSAAARKKIALAQKARWAKLRAAQRKSS